jgi:hypothetical protein
VLEHQIGAKCQVVPSCRAQNDPMGKSALGSREKRDSCQQKPAKKGAFFKKPKSECEAHLLGASQVRTARINGEAENAEGQVDDDRVDVRRQEGCCK